MESNIQDLIKKAESGDIEAQFDLALAYSKGCDIECNYEKAYNLWIELAAIKKVPAAMFNLGRMYLYGLGREKDIANAMQWFWKAHRHKNNCLNAINYIRLYLANEYLTTKPGTISDIHIKEIAEYKKEIDTTIDYYIENCLKQEVYQPYKFVDIISNNENKTIFLNIYPYPTSINQNGFKEFLCSKLLQIKALELSDFDVVKAIAYLDTSYKVIKDIPEAWVSDSYMDYCELKGKFYMKQKSYEEAIIPFIDILKYRRCCDMSQFPEDNENIKEKLSKNELEHLQKAEYSYYDAYVSLIECYLMQNLIHDAEEVACELYEQLKGRPDSWAIDWILGEIKKENNTEKQPNLIYILKTLVTLYINLYCKPLYNIIKKKVIYKSYNWSKIQCELIEAMFNLVIPYFEQKMEDYENKLTLTKLNLYKGEYLMQKKQFDDAKKMFLNALSFSNQLLLSDEVSNILGILEIRLYQILNRKADKQYYEWAFMFFINRRLLSGKIYGTEKFIEPILTSSN